MNDAIIYTLTSCSSVNTVSAMNAISLKVLQNQMELGTESEKGLKERCHRKGT